MKTRGGSRRAGLGTALLAVAALSGAALLAAPGMSASSGATQKKLVIYSIATKEQFLNHEDDRTRGKGNNPFGNFKDSTTPTKESGNGPFAGDRAMFTFNLFRDPDLKQAVGRALFNCQYNFNKDAFCQASYQLNGGQIVGEGAFNFNAPKFELVIVGGTGKYRGFRGDMQAAPAVKHAQRLTFVLG